MNSIRIAATLFGILALTSPAAWPANASWQPAAQPAAGWYPYYQQHGAAVYFNNSFWVIGCDTFIRRSSNGAAWEKAVETAPFGKRFGHCLLVFNNKLWLIGGAGSNSFTDFQLKNDVWSSSDGTNWTRVVANAPWSPRLDHAAIVFGGKMWIFGGSEAPHQNVSLDATSVNDIWYSSNGTDWTKATASAAWSARSGHQVVSYNGNLWLTGGSDKNDVWRSNNGKDWTRIASSCAWQGRRGHSVAVMNGKMWLVGGAFYKFEISQGSSPEFSYTTYSDVYSSSDGVAWNKEASGEWSNRYNSPCCTAGGTFWAFPGAYDRNGVKTKKIWKTSDGASWTRVYWELKTPLGVPNTACVHNSRLWLFTHEIKDGGMPQTAWTSTDGTHWNVQARDPDNNDTMAHESPFSFNGKIWQIYRYTGLQNSVDATTWTDVSNLPADGFVIPHQNQLWLIHQVMGLVGPIMTNIWVSLDSGKTWTPRLDTTHGLLLSTVMASFNGRVYSFGASVISSSNDAVNWPIIVNPTPWTGTAAVTVSGKQLWALSSAKELWSSPDGVKWTKACGPAPWASTDPVGRFVSVNDTIYYLSNQNKEFRVSYPTTGAAWRYDAKNGVWSKAWLTCQ